jgi:very-short-patch-repair endonuclease
VGERQIEGAQIMQNPNLSSIAKELRYSETESEKFLWTLLRAKKLNGVKFRRQEPVGQYVVDFVCFEKKLIIEIDGGQHSDEKNKEYDEIRTKWLQSQGFRVIRFWNNDVSSNIEGVITRIKEAL